LTTVVSTAATNDKNTKGGKTLYKNFLGQILRKVDSGARERLGRVRFLYFIRLENSGSAREGTKGWGLARENAW